MTEATLAAPPEEPLVEDWTPLAGILCDAACNAQAWVHVILPEGLDLFFCKHDFEVHEARLREVALVVQDKRESINKSPSPSASV